MLRQHFNIETLKKVVRQAHVIKWDMWKGTNDRDNALTEIIEKINDDGFDFTKFKEHKNIRTQKTIFGATKVEDFFAIQMTDFFIRKIYKVKQSDRRTIVKQLKAILSTSGDFYVLKLDIKDFYESIPFLSLRKKIEEDTILDPHVFAILEKIAKNIDSKFKGLPRGFSTSATLSEIYMREFDEKVHEMSSVIFYARYVDDMIFIIKDYTPNIFCDIKETLKACHLQIQEKKKEAHNITRKSNEKFDFLGYCFELSSDSKRNPRPVKLTIASKKIDRQKRKITLAFLDYHKNKDFRLLSNRIRFLSGLTSLYKQKKQTDKKSFLIGNAHNYSEISDPNSLKALDAFLDKTLKGDNRIGKLVSPIFSDEQKAKLRKIHFVKAHKDRLQFSFSKKRKTSIKKIWGHI